MSITSQVDLWHVEIFTLKNFNSKKQKDKLSEKLKT